MKDTYLIMRKPRRRIIREPSRAEPSRAEPSRAEPSRADHVTRLQMRHIGCGALVLRRHVGRDRRDHYARQQVRLFGNRLEPRASRKIRRTSGTQQRAVKGGFRERLLLTGHEAEGRRLGMAVSACGPLIGRGGRAGLCGLWVGRCGWVVAWGPGAHAIAEAEGHCQSCGEGGRLVRILKPQAYSAYGQLVVMMGLLLAAMIEAEVVRSGHACLKSRRSPGAGVPAQAHAITALQNGPGACVLHEGWRPNEPLQMMPPALLPCSTLAFGALRMPTTVNVLASALQRGSLDQGPAAVPSRKIWASIGDRAWCDGGAYSVLVQDLALRRTVVDSPSKMIGIYQIRVRRRHRNHCQLILAVERCKRRRTGVSPGNTSKWFVPAHLAGHGRRP